MVDVKAMKISEVMEDNPTLCLSPCRVFEKCYNCEKFKRKYQGNKVVPISRIIDMMKCKPRIKAEALALIEEERHKLYEIARIKAEIAEIERKLRKL